MYQYSSRLFERVFLGEPGVRPACDEHVVEGRAAFVKSACRLLGHLCGRQDLESYWAANRGAWLRNHPVATQDS